MRNEKNKEMKELTPAVGVTQTNSLDVKNLKEGNMPKSTTETPTLESMFVPNPHLKVNGWISVASFEELFLDNGIKRYEKFNRKKVWKKEDTEALRTSIYDGDLYNPMVLVPIEESITLARKNGNKEDEKFYIGAYEGGKNKWLTLIGGNRGESIQVILNENDDFNNIEFRKQLLPLTVTGGLSREDIHRKFQADLRGVVPNSQEARNSIWNGDNCESEWVRKISEKYSDMILDKHGLARDTQRMWDDEFVASLCMFTRYRRLGAVNGNSYDELIDGLYNENTTSSERGRVMDMLDYLHEVWGQMPARREQKKYWQSLIVMGGIIQDDNLTWFDKKSPKQFIENFNSWWLVKMTDEDTLYKPSKDKVTFKTMTGGYHRETHINFLRNMLNDFISDMLKEQILKVDRSEDLATPDQRNQLLVERKEILDVWVRQNGSVEEKLFDDNLPEFVLVPLSDLVDKVKYPTDHIIPKDVDFSDELSNMEITTQAYNSWKRKRIPDYKKMGLDEIRESTKKETELV